METIQKAINGDKRAFTELYKEYRQEIFSFLLGRMHSREDALDLTSDVFMAAFSGITSFRLASSFRTWLYGISRHKLNDYYGKKGLEEQRFEGLSEADDPMGSPEQIEANRISDTTQEIESNLDLDEILKKLTPGEQEILLMHNINGLQFSECANILNINEGYARVFHQRALMKAKTLATVLK